jgi:hypothetical protein
MTMASVEPDMFLKLDYAEYARDYQRRQTLEQIMEAKPQAVQREITLTSLAVLKAFRSDVHVFNEMLVQYPRPRRRRPGQVVPDNMVVIYEGELDVEESYDVPVQPVGPFWVMEYVSRRSKRKDYHDSFQKYERELQVPYCLTFWPQKKDLRLFRHDGRRYVRLEANQHGRYEIPELELEIGLHGCWVRYWYRGKLLPLPAEMQAQVLEIEKHAEREQQRAEREQQRAEREQQRAEHEQQRAEREQQRAESLQLQLEEERQARRAAERELAQVRARKGEKGKE